jgi:hypothetical protein
VIQDGTYVYNNWIGGNWGDCSTGFIFHDGSPQPNIKDNFVWNNVFVVGAGTVGNNTNGWVSGSNYGGGVVSFLNNTFIGSGTSDNSLAYNFYAANGQFTFEGNVITGIGNPISIHYPGKTLVDYNAYSDVCSLGNCWTWNSSDRGSFANWKTACACDAHSVSSASLGVNSDGTLQSMSPARSLGANLSGAATGFLTSLALDTTAGDTRTAVARPGGSTNWDAGAFQFAVISGGTTAPTGLTATVK